MKSKYFYTTFGAFFFFITGTTFSCSLSTMGKFSPVDDTASPEDGSRNEIYIDMPIDTPLPDRIEEEREEIFLFDGEGEVGNPEEEIAETMPEEIFSCVPFSTWCNPDQSLSVCDDSGSDFSTRPCPFTCAASPSPHCTQMHPSNGKDPSLFCVPGTARFAPRAPVKYVIFDTDDGAIYAFDENWNWLLTIREEGEGVVSGINYTLFSRSGRRRYWAGNR